MTLQNMPSWKERMICTNRGGHPSLLSIAQSAARFTVSNALVRSMKSRWRSWCCSTHFSWSIFPIFPDSKDHIHRAPLLSEATLALRHNVIQYVLGDPVQHDTGQYLACNAEEADPAVVVAGWAITLVLYKWMMLASLKSRGSWPLTQNTWNILVRWVIRVSPPALNTSAGIPSGPGALPVCSCLMAASTSAVLGGASSSGIMGRCWMDSSASLVTSEVRLSRVLKCEGSIASRCPLCQWGACHPSFESGPLCTEQGRRWIWALHKTPWTACCLHDSEAQWLYPPTKHSTKYILSAQQHLRYQNNKAHITPKYFTINIYIDAAVM